MGNNLQGLNLKKRRQLVGALGCGVGLGVGGSVHALQPKLENTPQTICLKHPENVQH